MEIIALLFNESMARGNLHFIQVCCNVCLVRQNQYYILFGKLPQQISPKIFDISIPFVILFIFWSNGIIMVYENLLLYINNLTSLISNKIRLLNSFPFHSRHHPKYLTFQYHSSSYLCSGQTKL